MDLNLLRSVVTVFGLLAFLALVAWAWQRARQDDFAAAARLPLDDAGPAGAGEKPNE